MRVNLYDHSITITTQDGTCVDLCTPLGSHFNMVIKDACRYHILQKLEERILDDEIPNSSCKKKKKTRVDMQGISARVDHVSTTAMLNYKKGAATKVTTDDRDYPDNEEGKDLCIPCGLSGTSYRRLQTIIAGSIRPPNRMIHTGRISECKCDHPDCEGVINNADHMFWDCEMERCTRQI